MSGGSIRVLVVDDSALVRRIITDSLAPFREIEVVGTAADPFIARNKLLALNPDVMTLDIEMPRMDGLTFLRLVMTHRPVPVVVFSSLTKPGSAKAVEALEAGAVDVLGKPGSSYSASADGSRLAEAIRTAAQARVTAAIGGPPLAQFKDKPSERTVVRPHSPTLPPTVLPAGGLAANLAGQIILIGASTGGTEAVKKILMGLPADSPGICVVQHIPAGFSRAFADRLNQLCQMEVREPEPGDRLGTGLALIAPGNRHLCLRRQHQHYVAELNDGPPVHHQRPSVDVLFNSAVMAGVGRPAVGVLLTGMGADGARGLLALRQAGTATIAQDEQSCVVFGMPREAIRLGAAQRVLPLDQIAFHVAQHFTSPALGNEERRSL